MRKINLSNFQVATRETARDINRRTVLNLIRTRRPASRADPARLTGLRRSTVSSITERLISEQWITEGARGHAPRGRRPRFLHLNSEGAGIIAGGELLRGATGLGAEPGHTSLNEEGPPCRCDNSGRREVYASNTATVE